MLQSSQPPLKSAVSATIQKLKQEPYKEILETQNYHCFFDRPYKALFGNHTVMRKFRGTILNFHESQNILKEFFFFFWQPLEGLSIKLN